jgi:D-alanyl-D-alanine carboxypeptidase/D-alanyl-D-alanine-endopeptidase (penicillin-binding protein 4)
MSNFCVGRFYQLLIINCSLLILTSCSIQKQISKSAKQVIGDSSLRTAHVGISIYEPAANKYWYNYQGDKYFTPASNTKLPTCYAAMKYLGDSLVGLRYGLSEKDNMLIILPTGDPTFLHEDFKNQPVFNFLQQRAKKNSIGILDTAWKDERWGSGWSWNDYEADYMAERSSMPIYGNVITIKLNKVEERDPIDTVNRGNINKIKDIHNPKMFITQNKFFDKIINQNTFSLSKENTLSARPKISIRREINSNNFYVRNSQNEFTPTSIPFVTDRNLITIHFLFDTLKTKFCIATLINQSDNTSEFYTECTDENRVKKVYLNNTFNTIYSQPTDSLLKPMMHRSDNFFAEQSLLMVSNERLGIMNDEKIIDTLLKTDFKDLPQKPRWVDGSGLSRYNLFTPQDFVAILNKMKNEFGMERIKNILPTGGTGTLENYYKADSNYIFAKTGTLSEVVSLSGYLYTKKNKLLIFSILINNHNSSATAVRRAVEKFIRNIRNNN